MSEITRWKNFLRWEVEPRTGFVVTGDRQGVEFLVRIMLVRIWHKTIAPA